MESEYILKIPSIQNNKTRMHKYEKKKLRIDEFTYK